jgi:periplasmic divalent cation tolerance protein
VPEHRYCVVLTTVDSRAVADALSHDVVAARLAACGQVLGPITSTYWWQDELQTTQEWQVQFKTSFDRYSELAALLRARHPYDVPEIVCTPIIDGNPAYLRWLDTETAAN